jgi:hypothetical protein
LWVIFALLDPDPDFGSGSTDLIESGSNPDPDPKHWSEVPETPNLSRNLDKYLLPVPGKAFLSLAKSKGESPLLLVTSSVKNCCRKTVT